MVGGNGKMHKVAANGPLLPRLERLAGSWVLRATSEGGEVFLGVSEIVGVVAGSTTETSLLIRDGSWIVTVLHPVHEIVKALDARRRWWMKKGRV